MESETLHFMKNISKRKEPSIKQKYNATYLARNRGYEVDHKTKNITIDSCLREPAHESVQLLVQNFDYKFNPFN